MVWDSTAPYGGFSTVKPWLPVKAPQLAHALDTQTGEDSVLACYRKLLALRPLGTGASDRQNRLFRYRRAGPRLYARRQISVRLQHLTRKRPI